MNVFKMKQRIVFLSFLFVLFFASYASAQSGCFINPESTYYCSDLTFAEAELECSLLGCPVEDYFFTEETCNDKELFTECQSVLCKSTCTQELLGRCQTGPVPEGQEDLWCSSGGCCQFELTAGKYCEYKSSKGLCEVEARNKDITEFSFVIDLSRSLCQEWCFNQASSPEEIETEPVSEINLLSKNKDLLAANTSTTSPTLIAASGIEVKDFTEVKIPKSNLLLFLFLTAFLIIILVVVYYFYRHPKQLKILLNKLKSFFMFRKRVTKTKRETKTLGKIFSPFFSNLSFRKRMELKKKRRRKIKDHQRTTFLSEHGLVPEKAKKDEVDKLKKIVHKFERKNKYHPKKTEDVFHNLEQVADKIKESEEKFQKKVFLHQRPKEKKDVDELIEKLRTLSKK